MSFPYKTILVIGATSGIGLALSERFIKNGIHVVAVGRRQEKLDELVSKHGEGKVSGYQFDVTKLDEIPSFVERYVYIYSFLISSLTYLNSSHPIPSHLQPFPLHTTLSILFPLEPEDSHI